MFDIVSLMISSVYKFFNFNFETGEVVSRLKGHRQSPGSILFSKNGELMATASLSSEDMSVIIYSRKTWEQITSFKFEDLVRTKPK